MPHAQYLKWAFVYLRMPYYAISYLKALLPALLSLFLSKSSPRSSRVSSHSFTALTPSYCHA
jgi:hypothetical protein